MLISDEDEPFVMAGGIELRSSFADGGLWKEFD